MGVGRVPLCWLCSGTSPHPGHEPPNTGICERDYPPLALEFSEPIPKMMHLVIRQTTSSCTKF